MVVIERELSGFVLKGSPTGENKLFSLVSGPDSPYPGFEYTISFPLPTAVRVLLTGPDRPAPPHDNVVLRSGSLPFTATVDEAACEAVIQFPASEGKRRQLRLNWSDSILLSIWEEGGDGWVRLCSDLSARSYALTEHGIMRHWWLERDAIHVGMGEKGAPLDLTGRSFQIHGSDSACYDAYDSESSRHRADSRRPTVQAHSVPRSDSKVSGWGGTTIHLCHISREQL